MSTSKPKKNTPGSNKHVFTLHHWTPTDWEYLKQLCETELNPGIVYLKVAQENGGEGDTPHLQGAFIFKSQIKHRPPAASKILMGPNKNLALPDPKNPGKFLKHHYHVDVMRVTCEEAANYCGNIAKEGSVPVYEYGSIPKSNRGTRTDYDEAQATIKKMAETGCKLEEIAEALPKFWANNEKWVRSRYNKYRKFKKNFFDENPMFQWQQDLVAYLNENTPDKRKILFIVDTEGNCGKSEISRNAEFLFPTKQVFPITPQDYKSMASLIPDDGADIVILDCPRQKQYDLPYDFIEELKTGSVVQTKYEPTKKEFPPMHIVVFMNRIPKTGKTILSADRYAIIEIQLEPEERDRLQSQQDNETAPYIEKHLKRTREILDTCEEEKAVKRAQYDEYTPLRDAGSPWSRPHRSL